ncbi:DNA-binding response regulator, NarL/FixJ family, contains REC and HTH domains [Streptomyces sp. DvalAA-14]|uniref:helix-turn-helix transcriptional regulator n=1 Tax=Streptomyces sp. DvalAA-14 TaxID=1839759 RepID=UPI00081BB139|nr:DNA-binding response regulator [Streptomyces sp. SID4948]SCE16822.1 DNA-binding response regulator, NarL/FixJ family, contains REC and HTH domains [Streptomyces sp. DvalAA-14]
MHSTGYTGSVVRTSPGATAPPTAIPVAVHAPDPVSLAGVKSQLVHQPSIELVDELTGRPGTVAVLVAADALDEPTLSALRRLVRTGGTRAVLVASTIREADLLQVIECGVGAIVWRHEATGHRLQQAVVAASRGDGDIPADLLGRLIVRVGAMQRGIAGPSEAPLHGLGPREVDVLRLVADGLDTGEIANKLSYSERTVKNVMHGLTTRLRLRNRAHAVAYALREGYI